MLQSDPMAMVPVAAILCSQEDWREELLGPGGLFGPDELNL